MKTKWNDDLTMEADGTGTLAKGWYAISPSGYECGSEAEAGPFDTHEEALKASEDLTIQENNGL